MADVLFIAVREDIERAETLAELFETAGVSIDSPFSEEALEACGAVVIVWSRAATRCGEFLTAAQSAIESGKAIVASLSPPSPGLAAATPTFDVSTWNGAGDAGVLDDFFYAAYGKAVAARRAAAEASPEPDAPLAANDNPLLDDPADFADLTEPRDDSAPYDPCAMAKLRLGAAWSAELPDAPLPVPQTRGARGRQRRAPLWDIALRTAGVALLLGAAIFGEAYRIDHAPVQVVDRSGFSQVAVTEFVTPPPTPMDATVEPPRWLREPESAPRS